MRQLGLETPSLKTLDRLAEYGNLLRHRAARRGFIGKSTVADLEIIHLADSLAAVPVIRSSVVARRGAILDVGTGAGLPGLPIAIFMSEILVGLLESSARRAAFLHATVEKLGIKNVRVICARAEDLGRDLDHRECYDIVLSRAMLPLSPTMELTLPFVRLGGIAVLYKTAIQAQDLRESDNVAAVLGGRAQQAVDYSLPGLRQHRSLVLYRKDTSTPSNYPRRSGIPAKRPL